METGKEKQGQGETRARANIVLEEKIKEITQNYTKTDLGWLQVEGVATYIPFCNGSSNTINEEYVNYVLESRERECGGKDCRCVLVVESEIPEVSEKMLNLGGITVVPLRLLHQEMCWLNKELPFE